MKNKSRKHWIVLAVLCGKAGGAIGICSNTVGVFYTPVSEDLGILRGTFALYSTLSLIATGVTSLVLPDFMKRFSYKKILFAGVLLAGLSTLGMSVSRSVILFYILGIIRGAGAGAFAAVPITMIINNWFEKKHGMATSIVFSFSGVAGAVCTPLLTGCIGKHGWQAGFLLQGAMIFVLALPAMVYPFTLKPESMHLLPYGRVGNGSGKKAPGNGKTAWLLAGAFVYGTVYSIGAVGIPLLTKYFFGAGNYSSVFSRIGLLTNIGQSSSLALIGYIYDFSGSYNYALLGAVGIHVMNMLLLFVISVSMHRREEK